MPSRTVHRACSLATDRMLLVTFLALFRTEEIRGWVHFGVGFLGLTLGCSYSVQVLFLSLAEVVVILCCAHLTRYRRTLFFPKKVDSTRVDEQKE